MAPFVPLREIIEFRRTQKFMPPHVRRVYRQILDTPIRLLRSPLTDFPAFKLSFTLGYFGQEMPQALLDLRNREGMSMVMGTDAEHPIREGRDTLSLFIEPRHLPLARCLMGNVPTRGRAKLERCRLQAVYCK